jgi:hypothetical protein
MTNNQVSVNSIEAEQLREDFEILARSVKCSSAAHTFSGAEGVSVVWNSPLNCFRNSIACKAVVTHEPGRLPANGTRFLEHVDRLTCRELVLAQNSNQTAFTQHWNFTRKGNFEHYIFTRVFKNDTRDTTEIVVNTRTQTSKAKRYQFEF